MLGFPLQHAGDSFKEPDAKTVFQADLSCLCTLPEIWRGLASSASAGLPKLAPSTRVRTRSSTIRYAQYARFLFTGLPGHLEQNT